MQCKAYHLLLYSADVNSSTPPYVFMLMCLIILIHLQQLTYSFIPLYNWFSSPKTKFRHLSLSLSLSLVSPCVSLLQPHSLLLQPPIFLWVFPSLVFPHIPTVGLSVALLFPDILSTCPNHCNRFTQLLLIHSSLHPQLIQFWCHFISFFTLFLCGSSPKLQLTYVPQGDKTCTRVKLLIF